MQFFLYEVTRGVLVRERGQMVGPGAGGGEGGVVSNGDRASVWEDEKGLEMRVVVIIAQ